MYQYSLVSKVLTTLLTKAQCTDFVSMSALSASVCVCAYVYVCVLVFVNLMSKFCACSSRLCVHFQLCVGVRVIVTLQLVRSLDPGARE